MPPSSGSTAPQNPASITYRQDAKTGIQVATWLGHMTDQAMLSHYRRYYGAADYDPTCSELADLRGLTRIDLTTVGLKKLASLAARFQRRGRTAIVTDNDLSFGLGRMYNVFGPDATNRIEVFRDIDDALAWLGHPGAHLDRAPADRVG